jgi:hypothetical protein
MAEVPANYIRNAAIDWAGELAACFGLDTTIAGVRVPPVTIGRLALLEHIDCLAISHPDEADPLDCLRCLFILANGESAAHDVLSEANWQGKRAPFDRPDLFTAFDIKVLDWAIEKTDGTLVKAPDFSAMVAVAFAGWKMIPAGKGLAGEYLFGPESLAAMVMICEPLGLSLHQIMWEVPLCFVGHLAARTADSNGTKGVARPKDHSDIVRQLELAKQRDGAGELHPWQIDRPDIYKPTPEQIKARPSILDDFAKCEESYRAKWQK